MKKNRQLLKISIIIPVYNEEACIVACLNSLALQQEKPAEIIIIDDGSSDHTLSIVEEYIKETKDVSNKLKIIFHLLRQKHAGPGVARNKGVEKSSGEVVVFVDADMTFDEQFLFYLTKPIEEDSTSGTFTKEEYVKNWNNVWARCWNYNEGLFDRRRIPKEYPAVSPVFRAIRKSEFLRVGGFDDIGFTDDWSLSRKLGYHATMASGAICYHENPASLSQVFVQSAWIGKNEFISGTWMRRIVSLWRYNYLSQLLGAFFTSIYCREPQFILFSLVYSTGIMRGIIGSILGEQKSK